MKHDPLHTDFLFVGGVIPPGAETEVLSKIRGGNQLAANNFQWSLIRGFDENMGAPITLFNYMFVGSYPKNYADCLVKPYRFSHAPGAVDYQLGFVNITMIKQLLRPFGERRILKQWVTRNKDQRHKVVFIYSLSEHFIRIARLLKKYNPNVFICISVNDLPQFTMLGKRGHKLHVRAWKAYNRYRVMRALRYIDGYMPVTEHIATGMGVHTKPHVVVEALVETDGNSPVPKPVNDDFKRIVYTGGLTGTYGVWSLVEAFRGLQGDRYRLIICGDGDDRNAIIEAAGADTRIEYRGVLSPDEVRKVQQEATVLVNPRTNAGTYTRYSFPIKTLEYLHAGRPVIAYKLDGIPAEYDEYLMYVENDAVETLRQKLRLVCNMPAEELESIGQRNRQFVLQHKNHRIQTARILEMIFGSMDSRTEQAKATTGKETSS
jgi:glycosyltransferase involved in cell wall biosynthesis